jgi:hypothetical protein
VELDILGPDGARPPAGMFSVTPSGVVLPANGTVAVRVTANTRVAGPDGVYSGRLIASDGEGRSLAIPLAVNREVESYNLTVQHRSRNSEPTSNWFSNTFAYDRNMFPWLSVPSTPELTIRLPKGRYAWESFVFDDDFVEPLARIVAPNQLLDADRVLVIDASLAEQIVVPPAKPDAEELGTTETWAIVTDTTRIGSALSSSGFGDIPFYRAEVEPPAAELTSILSSGWLAASADPKEVFTGAWTGKGQLPTGPFTIIQGEAATVHAYYSASLPTSQPINEVSVGAYGGPTLGFSLSPIAVDLPSKRKEFFYSPDPTVQWVSELWMHDEEYSKSSVLGWVPYTYAAGEKYTVHWNRPMFSPAVPEDSALGGWAYRDGDLLVFQPPLYGDRDGHAGFVANEGTTRLYRNGQAIGEGAVGGGGYFEIPPEPASYRIELDHHQDMFEYTPHQKVSWTFASGHVAEGSQEAVPLLVVRFAPELDERGLAPSGVPFHLPFSVDQLDHQGRPEVSTPTVEVSYDDGGIWDLVAVEATDAGYDAVLDHPDQARYVSLRTSTHDAHGNAVEQTLYRAYGLAR